MQTPALEKKFISIDFDFRQSYFIQLKGFFHKKLAKGLSEDCSSRPLLLSQSHKSMKWSSLSKENRSLIERIHAAWVLKRDSIKPRVINANAMIRM